MCDRLVQKQPILISLENPFQVHFLQKLYKPSRNIKRECEANRLCSSAAFQRLPRPCRLVG